MKNKQLIYLSLALGLHFTSLCQYKAMAEATSNAQSAPLLNGTVQQSSTAGELGEGTALPDNNKNYLKGLARMEEGGPEVLKDDPDADDKELMIAWDRWRNRFLQAVIASVTENLNSDQARSFQFNPATLAVESKYPLGTIAWFGCEVTKDRQIRHLRILKSSGFPAYDRVVMEAVQALQDSSILRFPTGSRRVVVLQSGGVERSAVPQQQYFHFGDIEHYRVPAY